MNAVLPGGIYTRMAVEDGSLPADINKNFAEQPIPRIGHPEEVGRAVLYLASDESSYSSGAEILVDGGMTAAPLMSPIPKHVPRAAAGLVRESWPARLKGTTEATRAGGDCPVGLLRVLSEGPEGAASVRNAAAGASALSWPDA